MKGEYMLDFILGVVFIEVVIPFLETAMTAITIKLEAYKSKKSVEIAKNNRIIQQLSDETEEEPKNFIGFAAPKEVEEE
jgi:hypothetical protein